MVTEVERLKALQALELLDTAPEAEYDSIAELAAMIAGAPMAAVSLVDEDRQWFKANIGIPAPETGRDVAFCHHAIEGDDIYVAPDATKDPLFRDNPLVTGEPDIRAYAGVPLRAPCGAKIGTLCVIHRELTILEDRVKERLKALGKTIEQILLIRARSREMEANNRVLEALNKVQAEFITKRGSREAFDSVLDTVLELTESRFGFIGSIETDEQGPFLRARVISNIAWDAASMTRYAEEIEDGLIFRNDGTLLART
jgi:GAF domain-containing protein